VTGRRKVTGPSGAVLRGKVTGPSKVTGRGRGTGRDRAVSPDKVPSGIEGPRPPANASRVDQTVARDGRRAVMALEATAPRLRAAATAGRGIGTAPAARPGPTDGLVPAIRKPAGAPEPTRPGANPPGADPLAASRPGSRLPGDGSPAVDLEVASRSATGPEVVRPPVAGSPANAGAVSSVPAGTGQPDRRGVHLAIVPVRQPNTRRRRRHRPSPRT
jgi:hypothetical protein